MLAINLNNKHAIYSLGKTGTTSLVDVLDDSWYATGEISPDFMCNLFPNDFSGHVNQLDALKFLYNKQYKITAIVRDPWKRYVSGVKEILQDSLNVLVEDPIQTFFMDLPNDQLIAHLDRVYYLSEFMRQKDFPFDKHFVYPSDFALHHNYHIRNWLWEINDFDNIEVIDSKELDAYIKILGFQPKDHLNKSDPKFILKLEECIKQTNIYFYIKKYLQSEIVQYNLLINNKKSEKNS